MPQYRSPPAHPASARLDLLIRTYMPDDEDTVKDFALRIGIQPGTLSAAYRKGKFSEPILLAIERKWPGIRPEWVRYGVTGNMPDDRQRQLGLLPPAAA